AGDGRGHGARHGVVHLQAQARPSGGCAGPVEHPGRHRPARPAAPRGPGVVGGGVGRRVGARAAACPPRRRVRRLRPGHTRPDGPDRRSRPPLAVRRHLRRHARRAQRPGGGAVRDRAGARRRHRGGGRRTRPRRGAQGAGATGRVPSWHPQRRQPRGPPVDGRQPRGLPGPHGDGAVPAGPALGPHRELRRRSWSRPPTAGSAQVTTSVSAPTRRVVAIIPAFRSAPTIGDAIAALRSIAFVAEVVVVDDGSGDGTPDAARAAGATVIELGINRGKGGAVTAAVEATPWADVYLLVDDDVGRTATAVEALLAPVLAGDADMTIGVLPSANGGGGFGFVRDTARWGIERASGYRTQAPLSGQRAVSAPLLRSLLPLAPRFGLETGLTIDAARQGARVVEVGVEMDHHHRGRSISGFAHRAHQGGDVVRALWTRLTTSRARIALLVAAL